MVKICSDLYPSNSKYEEYFELYSYPLSDFQKYAIEAIIEGHHTLVTAHTGSGKTLPAEFAIRHFTNSGKKVIYTSPIKALSNQKYYEFTRKYPEISFGLMTGDIKTNPDADVLIMTTEILMNSLFLLTDAESKTQNLSFNIDINNDLACVVFDEVHYINDADRGQTWEKTILMLPRHIQMVMLSATIDAPERFAKWCERDDLTKEVYLASTSKRVVPLSHYGYLVSSEGFIKGLKDKVLEKDVRDATKRLIMLQNDKGEFLEGGYKTLKNTTDLFDKKQQHIKRKHVLNDLALFLRDREMLPAIGFVFSRKQVEMCAHEITVPLLEDDSKVGYNVRRECEQIIRKFTNYQEYLELPEYNDLVSLLEKGIGIHHSGMIPVLREIVELMISKKYIKLLFATESFAIGLDCPIKTAIFTGLMKFDGSTERYLMSHEYTQMAGRAGRRGIDTIGYVVHCNNLFSLPSKTDYCDMLGGRPQELVSKFRISYSLILNLLKNGKTKFQDFVNFVNNSMVKGELTDAIEKQKSGLIEAESNFKNKEKSISNLQTPIEICQRYLHAETNLKTSVNKKRKEMEKTLSEIEFEHRFIKSDVSHVKAFYSAKTDYENEVSYLTTLENHIFNELNKVTAVLLEQGFVLFNDETYSLTEKGKIASGIAEIHPLVTAGLFEGWNWFQEFYVDQLIGFLAVFTDVKIDEDTRSWQIKIDDAFLNTRLNKVIKEYSFYENLEDDRGLKTGINYLTALNYDMPELLTEWIKTDSQEDCKWFIQTCLYDKGISIGDFTKAVMKISTIAKEWSNIAEESSQIELLYKLGKIDSKILKYVTTSQSLYV